MNRSCCQAQCQFVVLYKEVFTMVDLQNEYTDINAVTHKVVHITPAYDKDTNENIKRELYNAFTESTKHISA